jgi:putative sigma-54 modulation protein
MLVNVKGKNIEITNAIRKHTEKKVEKLEKYFKEIKSAVVNLKVEGSKHIAEVQLEGDGITIRGEERRATDMYGAIDLVVDKLETRVKKFKDRRFGRGVEKGPKEKESFRAAQTEAVEVQVEEDFPHIVKTKRFNLKPMTPDEATMEMELIHHDFFAFINAETGAMNVVYKREDGNYGLIEPI